MNDPRSNVVASTVKRQVSALRRTTAQRANLFSVIAITFLALAAAGCGAADPAGPSGSSTVMEVLPAAVVTPPGGTVPFSAEVLGAVVTDVAWSVQEPGGGSVDASGRYTAPATTGVFHVIASSAADPQASASATVTVATSTPATQSLGVNITAVNDWDPSLMFADAMKGARHFGSMGQPSDEAAAEDAQGWPTGDAGVVVMVGIPHMGGTYKLSFTGQATAGVNAALDPGTHVANVAYDAGSNTTSADVVVGAAEQNLFLTFVGQAGGVKNVRLMRPGQGPTELFGQAFLARLAHFQTLRFMDYAQTNSNPQVSWADRSLPGNASQQRRPDGATVGAAWEYVVLLANQTGKDVWINVPHQASDDYVTRLARLLRYGSDGVNPYASPQANPVFPPLDAGRKVYVEWSNEVWNGGFAQSGYAGVQADAAIAANDQDLVYDGNTNHYAILFRYVGKRSMQVSNLFRAVFGDAAMMSRVRPVLPAQIANAGTLAEPLAYLAARHGGASAYFYAAAGAPYVTVNDDDAGTRSGLTLDTIFAEMTSYAEVNVHTWMNTFSGLCAANGIKMVAYEGGQHLYGTGSTDVKIAAQLDPRMKGIILLNYANWTAAGGDLFVHYNLCSAWDRYGSWGLSSDITSEATPKWEAVAQIAASVH